MLISRQLTIIVTCAFSLEREGSIPWGSSGNQDGECVVAQRTFSENSLVLKQAACEKDVPFLCVRRILTSKI